jgi:hypothetical protein
VGGALFEEKHLTLYLQILVPVSSTKKNRRKKKEREKNTNFRLMVVGGCIQRTRSLGNVNLLLSYPLWVTMAIMMPVAMVLGEDGEWFEKLLILAQGVCASLPFWVLAFYGFYGFRLSWSILMIFSVICLLHLIDSAILLHSEGSTPAKVAGLIFWCIALLHSFWSIIKAFRNEQKEGRKEPDPVPLKHSVTSLLFSIFGVSAFLVTLVDGMVGEGRKVTGMPVILGVFDAFSQMAPFVLILLNFCAPIRYEQLESTIFMGFLGTCAWSFYVLPAGVTLNILLNEGIAPAMNFAGGLCMLVAYIVFFITQMRERKAQADRETTEVTDGDPLMDPKVKNEFFAPPGNPEWDKQPPKETDVVAEV